MVFWFAACSAAIVWLVFQSPAFDYRLVMAGSLLGLVELPFGPGPFQSLSLSVLVLGAVMVEPSEDVFPGESGWEFQLGCSCIWC